MFVVDMIKQSLHEICEAIFPSDIYCVLCGRLIDSSRSYSLCDECIRKMHWIGSTDIDGKEQGVCQKCGKAIPGAFHSLCYDCMQLEHLFTKGFSCLTYGLHERELLMKMKYSGHGFLGRIFGDILFDRMEGELPALGIDLVIPVPVSERRYRRRGYNQSALMARQFIFRWRLHAQKEKTLAPLYDEHILVRARETTMLRSLNPAERRLVMMDAFAVRPGTEDRVAGRSILVIDDIYTTGATLDAASKTLLDAGAKAVYILTLASGGNRRPKDLDEDSMLEEEDHMLAY